MKLYCPQCDEKLTSEIRLAEHLQSAHGMTRDAALKRAYEVGDEVKTEGPRIATGRRVEKLPPVPIRTKRNTPRSELPITSKRIESSALVNMIQSIKDEITRLEDILEEARRLLK